MEQPAKLLDRLREHKGLRQASALFVKNALVAWRSRWATILRLMAPLLFLSMALMTQEVMNMNARRTGRTRDMPSSVLESVGAIPSCHSELFIADKPCFDFVFTPNNSDTVRAIVASIQRHNTPPIPDERVMGFASRAAADNYIQARSKYTLGAVHFSLSASSQLQYIVQTNTSVPSFKGYVQSPNDFFQVPFVSAISREVTRHYLTQAGRADEAEALVWSPRLAAFPHPQLSPGTAGYILPPFIFVACMFATISHLSSLVQEKESGLRQALQTMGLLQGSYWLSWWLFEAVMAAISAWCIIGFGTILRLEMFTANNVFLQFFLFWLFGLAMASFACCTSVFLSNSQSAGNAGLAMILMGWVCQALAAIGMPYSPSILLSSNGMGKAFFWVFAIFPWNPLTKGILDMGAEATKSGLRFSDRHSYCRYVPSLEHLASGADMTWLYMDDNCLYSLEQCYITLLVQTVAWMIAAIYFDNVQPNKHGVRLPYWYPLSPRYWANLFRKPGSSGGGSLLAACPGSAKLHGPKSPFATSETAKKVAKSITEAKVAGDQELVIRCSSSAGGAPPRAASGFGLGVQASAAASVARHSVSSGILRRRDHRASSSGVSGEPTGLEATPSRIAAAAGAGASTVGRLPHFPGAGAGASHHGLLVQPSVTVLRLSDASSDAHGLGHGGFGAGAAAGGMTMSLAQYTAMQAAKGGGAAGRRWWDWWRVGEDSLGPAARKHTSMVAAAAGGAGPAVVLSKQEPGTAVAPYGVTPVVLDPGVLQEEQRMKAALYADSGEAWSTKQDLVQVFGLRKVYQLAGARRCWWWPFGSRGKRGSQQPPQQRQYVAVADSWFGVPKGQLLCLLGPNGAGKTTTINCLIGALPPSGGDVRVMGHSLLAADGLEHAQGVMGVCPQFDVLWDELTGKEHMYIYGCIKGLPSCEVLGKGAALLDQVQLTSAAAKRSSSYSGGMKRRLSVALALLGSPQLVFLDEPSTGMDPISRRAVWDAIDAAKQHAAVVLTTHSMEEADALGDRIGIMVRGRLRVLGGSLSLKQKYGNGYQLRMRLKDAAVSPDEAELALAAEDAAATGIPLEATLSKRFTSADDGYGLSPDQIAQAGTPRTPKSPLGQLMGAFSRRPAAGNLGAAELHSDSRDATPRGSRRPTQDCAELLGTSGGAAAGCRELQELVVQHLGLAPTEEGRQGLQYVIPQALAPQLQVLLELLDLPQQQAQLGLAEVHVSLASLEEVFLAVVKQAEQDYAALTGQTVVMHLPASGQQLEVPVGQEVAVDPTDGQVYAVEWVQDEFGKLAVVGVRQMEAAEQQQYWQHRHLQQ